MNLDHRRCQVLLTDAESGVLATVHPTRGVDAVPACFVVRGEVLGIPVDRVKPKGRGELQRVRNLRADPRAALLCDHWDGKDWSRLWWVRATLEYWPGDDDTKRELEAMLRAKYRQYEGQPFDDLLVFRITALSGWSASEG